MASKVKRNESWIWMPHAGHFICGNDCRFHMATKVGKYLVSTVGELWPSRGSRECHAKVYDPKWLEENISRKGDDFDYEYMKKFGFETIGHDRKYETMVFKAVKAKEKKSCCPWRMDGSELDFLGYNKPEDAYAGHMKLCKKWSKK